MNKEEAEKIFMDGVYDITDFCPHCAGKTHLSLKNWDTYKNNSRDLIFYAIFKCVPCEKLVFKTFRFDQYSDDPDENFNVVGWINKFPDEDFVIIDKFEGMVPKDVLADFEEGVICAVQKCNRAAVSMFRRSLQSALLEKGSNKAKDLITQIKESSFLTKDIKDWAHNIRIFGNWGAHPQDDDLKDVDEKLVNETQSFLEEFFNYVYVMPSRVEKAQSKNKKEK